MGTIALVGGNEFRVECQPLDNWLLLQTGSQRPQVTILPTAAADEGLHLAAENGIRHFTRLGAHAQAAMIFDKISANDPREIAKLEQADLVYLTGGSPWLLLNVLQDSNTLAALFKVKERGGIIAGSSAGAMVLAEKMREILAAAWQPALCLIEGVAVLPHYNKVNANYDPLRKALEPHVAMLGIEEATAAIQCADGKWTVIGVGGVTVHRMNEKRYYKSTEVLSLSL